MTLPSDSPNNQLITETRQLILSRICLENVHPRDVQLLKEEDWFIDKFVVDTQLNGEKDVVSSAASALESCLLWRMVNKINDLNELDFPLELHQKSAYILDFDASTLYIQASKHQKVAEWSEIARNFLLYNVEKCFQHVRAGKGTLVTDLLGSGIANIDLDQMYTVMDLTTKYYPQMIGKMVVVDINFIFSPLLKIVTKLLPDKYRRTMVVAKRKDLSDVLGNEFPTFLGGSKTVEPTLSGQLKSIDEIGLLNGISYSGISKYKKFLDENVD